MMYKPFVNNRSQFGQDMFLFHQYFKHQKDGFFVDIGAYDGLSFSNTFLYEKEFSWKGICIEPIPEIFSELRKNRDCLCIQGGIAGIEEEEVPFLSVTPNNGFAQMLSGIIGKQDPRLRSYIEEETRALAVPYQEIKIKTFRIDSLLKLYDVRHIDFVSLDTEGGELEILESWNFDLYPVEILCVENNYSDPNIMHFLKSKGFTYITNLQQDEIYKKNGF